MAKAEVRIMVEYIIEMPADIMLSKVDDFIKNEIDEGADSSNIRSRTITDVAFSEQPGIVDKYNIVRSAINLTKEIIDANKDESDKGATLQAIMPIVDGALEEVGSDEDED